MARKKKARSSGKKKENKPDRFLGISLLVFSVLVLLSFVNNGVDSKNMLGPAGEIIERFFYVFLGKASMIIPFITGFYAVQILKGNKRYADTRYLLGFVIFVFALSIFTALAAAGAGAESFKMKKVSEFTKGEMREFWNGLPEMLRVMDGSYTFYTGGAAGKKTADFLASWFNTAGAYILNFIMFAVAVILFGKEEILIKIGRIFHGIIIKLIKTAGRSCVIIWSALAEFSVKIRGIITENRKNKKDKRTKEKISVLKKNKDDKHKEAGEKTEKPKKQEQEKTAGVQIKEKKKKEKPTVITHEDKPKERKAIQAVRGDFTLPSTEFLKGGSTSVDKKDYTDDAEHLRNTLLSFGIEGDVVNIVDGPALARFEVELSTGTKVSRVQNLAGDIALAMRVEQVRIAPVHGKSLLGIEVPKTDKKMIFLKELIEDDRFQENNSLLTMAIGRDLGGAPVMADLKNMPHMLIAGATGSGKSVCINTIIMSFIYKASPDELKLILVDPKRVELTHYRDLAHLIAPVITDVKHAAYVLKKLTYEMDYRYDLLAKEGARDIDSYNEMVNEYNEELKKEGYDPDNMPEPAEAADGEDVREGVEFKKNLPYIVLVIDELADLMTLAKANVEASLQRLAQLARAVGIHIILATQRPSVDVITGVIKANFPSRIAFQVMSQVDSRTILDAKGAESLLGKGDMLYAPAELNKPIRGQAAFVSVNEISKVVHFIKKQRKPEISPEFDLKQEDADLMLGGKDSGNENSMFQKAVDLAKAKGNISTSYLQRKLGIGYSKAARIIDDMEEKGIISGPDGNKPREYTGE